MNKSIGSRVLVLFLYFVLYRFDANRSWSDQYELTSVTRTFRKMVAVTDMCIQALNISISPHTDNITQFFLRILFSVRKYEKFSAKAS